MRSRYRHFASWVTGFLGLFIVAWIFEPTDIAVALRSIGLPGVFGWLALTLVARVILIETTVRPIEVLGFGLRRADAFWIAWMRSFSNQVLPLSGVALYAHQIRRKIGISWSELAALSTPQFFLAALAIGLVGITATLSNFASIGPAAIPLMFAYVAVSCGAIFTAKRSDWLIELLPRPLSTRAGTAAASFRKLAQNPYLVAKLVAFHSAAILTRGSRMWLLFAAVGSQLDWQQALFVVALAESAVIVQLTPAGLGLREGAIVGAAALLNVPLDISTSVALIDRLFVLVTTTAFAGPAFVMTQRVRGLSRKYEET